MLLLSSFNKFFKGGGGGGCAVGCDNGACCTGGNGGSGVAIFSYPSALKAPMTTGSMTKSIANGQQIYIFSAAGTITFKF